MPCIWATSVVGNPYLASLPNIRHEKDCRGTSRNAWQAIGKGMRGICPPAVQAGCFAPILRSMIFAPHCGEELYHHRADDAPPYLTILVVGHIVGSLNASDRDVLA